MELKLTDYILRFYPEYRSAGWETVEEYDCSVFDTCATAVAIYRVQRKIKDRPDCKPLLNLLSLLQKQLCGCEIYYSAEIGENFLLVHGLGTVIGSGVVIGNNVTIYHNVTLGTKYDTDKKKCRLEDDVIVYAGAKILGDITIGKGAVVGANSVVLKTVPEKEVVAGIPARKIGMATNNKYKLPPGSK